MQISRNLFWNLLVVCR